MIELHVNKTEILDFLKSYCPKKINSIFQICTHKSIIINSKFKHKLHVSQKTNFNRQFVK